MTCVYASRPLLCLLASRFILKRLTNAQHLECRYFSFQDTTQNFLECNCLASIHRSSHLVPCTHKGKDRRKYRGQTHTASTHMQSQICNGHDQQCLQQTTRDSSVRFVSVHSQSIPVHPIAFGNPSAIYALAEP